MTGHPRRGVAAGIGLLVVCCLLFAPLPLSSQGGDEVRFEPPAPPARTRAALSGLAGTVRLWGMIQRVAEAVEAQNARDLPLEEIRELDRAWSRGREPEALSRELLSNDCARALQSLLAANPGYLSVFVADARGALVCMSSRASAYWWWEDLRFYGAWDEGRGAAFVSSERTHEPTGASVRYISVPVLHQGNAVGVLVASRAL